MLDRVLRNGAVNQLSTSGVCWRCQIQRLPYRTFRTFANPQYSDASSSPPTDGVNGEKKKQAVAKANGKSVKAAVQKSKKATAVEKPKKDKPADASKPRRLVRKTSTVGKVDAKKKKTGVIAAARERQDATRMRLLRHLARNEKEAKVRSVESKGKDEDEPVTFAELSGREADAPVSGTGPPELVVKDVEFKAIERELGAVPRLAHGLERALFNRGVLQLRDIHSRVYNVDPALEIIPPPDTIDFKSFPQFTPPSKDATLAQIAKDNDKKFVASTSSLTGMLKHFHFLLSAFRTLNFKPMSSENKNPPEVTKITLSPEAVILRYQDGFYSVDGDKEFDSPNVMSLMGRYLERYLTVDLATFEKHKAGKSLKAKDIDQPEAYHYSTIGDFVMRSQLDAHDPRLPAPGIFDLKTRSCLPIRMASSDFEWGMDYELTEQTGDFSYEREYVDMARATMLKYMLQARIGRMDGIFVAYHNLARIFGFQYLSINDMDLTLHGQYDRTLGDQEFLASMHFLDQLVNQAVAKFPGQSLRIHVETRPSTSETCLQFFAEPITTKEIEALQKLNKDVITEYEQQIVGATDQAKTPVSPQADDPSTGYVTLKSDTDRFRARVRQILDDRKHALAKHGSLRATTQSAQEAAAEENRAAEAAEDQAAAELTATPAPSTEVSTESEVESIPAAASNEVADAAEVTTSEVAPAQDEDVLDEYGWTFGKARASAEVELPSAPSNSSRVLGDSKVHISSAGTSSTTAPAPPAATTPSTPPTDTSALKLSSKEAYNKMIADRKARPSEKESPETAPLFAAILRIAHKVNNKRTVRPMNLKPTDDWRIAYSISHPDPARAWKAYEFTKHRRKSNLKGKNEERMLEDAIAAASGEEARYDSFRAILKGSTARAKKWRVRRDELDAVQEEKDGGVRVWDREWPVKRGGYTPRV